MTNPEAIEHPLGHRYAATVRQRLVSPGLDLTVQRGTGFTGGRSVAAEPEIVQSVTVLSEARQTVKRFRREMGKARGSSRSLSPRQWKRARRFLKWQGLV